MCYTGLMSDTFSINELESEAEELRSTIAALKMDLETKETRLSDLEFAITTLRRLKGEEPKPDVQREPETFRRWVAMQDFGDRKRVPSTTLVADIVSVNDAPMSREEIHDGFERSFPDVVAGWSNPVNALNNAIARAVEKGMIQELEDGTFDEAQDRRPKYFSARGGL